METYQKPVCKYCKKQLSDNLLRLQEAPDASDWLKEGFCSKGCYKQYLSEINGSFPPKTSTALKPNSAENKKTTTPSGENTDDIENIMFLHSLGEDESIENISWNKCDVIGGKAWYKCTNCDTDYRIKETDFVNIRATKTTDYTSKKALEINTSPAPISYNLPAFIIASVVGSLLLLGIGTDGNIPFWITLFSVLIFLVLSKVIKSKKSHLEKIPVWYFICPKCNKKNYVASNGYTAYYGGDVPM